MAGRVAATHGRKLVRMNLSTAEGGKAGELPPFVYEDQFIKDILSNVRVVAMVGASPTWNRPSFFTMQYMQNNGYRVVPINPTAAGTVILGEYCFASLKEAAAAGVQADMVDVFRVGEVVVPVAKDAIAIGAKVLWLQLSVRNAKAASLAEAAGLAVVQDRCPKIELARLYGDLGWHGHSGIAGTTEEYR